MSPGPYSTAYPSYCSPCRHRRLGWLASITVALAGPQIARAQAAHDLSQPISVTVGAESVRLPGSERMGLLGTGLLFEIAPAWWLGPAVYSAATGQRGGLFVGGVEVQRRWQFDRTSLTAGLYAGGGGGAAAPVGDGLMLRPALAVMQDLGPVRAGLSWSLVRFAGTPVHSSQVGLQVTWDGSFRHADVVRAGQQVSAKESSGLGFEQQAGVLSRYTLHNRGQADRSIGLVGTRLVRHVAGSPFTWGFEAAAAAQGDAAGYMELLAGAGWEWRGTITDALGWSVGVRGAAGLGGGGAVPTGGGLIGKVLAGASVQSAGRWSAGFEAGALRTRDTEMQARVVQGWIAWDLESIKASPTRAQSTALTRVEWAGAVQRYSDALRKDGTRRALDTVGLRLSRFLDENLYVTGQAHSAFGGGAGAFSIGLLGAGVATSTRTTGWRAGAELTVGAAGGGGVSTGGGALTQALVWGAWAGSPQAQWRAAAGTARTLGGAGLSSPVVELSWSRAFGQAMP